MELVTYIALAFCAAQMGLLVACAIFFWRMMLAEFKRHEGEKAELRKMIRDLQNRLSAKDLTGYFALKNQEEPRPTAKRREVTPLEDNFSDQAFMGFKG